MPQATDRAPIDLPAIGDAIEEELNKYRALIEQDRQLAEQGLSLLAGEPWCVTTEDAGSAVLLTRTVESCTLSTVHVDPTLCGFSCFDREVAERVCAEMNKKTMAGLWRLTLHSDMAKIRVRALGTTLTTLRSILSEA